VEVSLCRSGSSCDFLLPTQALIKMIGRGKWHALKVFRPESIVMARKVNGLSGVKPIDSKSGRFEIRNYCHNTLDVR
jgi:hypothetical protein